MMPGVLRVPVMGMMPVSRSISCGTREAAIPPTKILPEGEQKDFAELMVSMVSFQQNVNSVVIAMMSNFGKSCAENLRRYS